MRTDAIMPPRTGVRWTRRVAAMARGRAGKRCRTCSAWRRRYTGITMGTPTRASGTILRLTLGDQLNPRHPWLSEVDEACVYVLMEVRQETDYVLHPAQKILATFAGMRELARQLRTRPRGALHRHRRSGQSAIDPRQSGCADRRVPRCRGMGGDTCRVLQEKILSRRVWKANGRGDGDECKGHQKYRRL